MRTPILSLSAAFRTASASDDPMEAAYVAVTAKDTAVKMVARKINFDSVFIGLSLHTCGRSVGRADSPEFVCLR